MFKVIRTDAGKDINDKDQKFICEKVFKKSFNSALKYAHKKNNMISNKTFRIHYVVYNALTNTLHQPE